MPVSRRGFLTSLGAGGAGIAALPLIGARGREALYALPPLPRSLPVPSASRRRDRMMAGMAGMIRLDSNENPDGPGPRVLEAMHSTFSESNRYPAQLEQGLVDAIAKSHGVTPENILLGCGSGEILRVAVQALTSADRALVNPVPTFESAANYAKFIGSPVRPVPVDGKLNLDLGAMADASRGAGLVYLCNPNNPTATVHGAGDVASFIEQVGKSSPNTYVLVDEAYHEFVVKPEYKTAVPIALANPHVIVSRTFSKIFGLAGMRVGYAIGQPATLKRLSGWVLDSNVTQLSLAAAITAVSDRDRIVTEQKRNHATRDFTTKFFENAGYTVAKCDANFLMVDIRRDVRAFKTACLKQNVAVGRAFPPLMTQLRVSFGTMDEMQAATKVFKAVLAEA